MSMLIIMGSYEINTDARISFEKIIVQVPINQ